MKIVIARAAGFCMGVRRAIEAVLDASGREEKPIYTYGPLIHNPQVLDLLKKKKISVLENIPARARGTLLIRAHGIAPAVKKKLQQTGFKLIDATCPRVINVQNIIRKYSAQGYATIIVGDKNHPEVVGLMGFAADRVFVVDSIPQLDALPAFPHALIVAQTTANTLFFEEVTRWADTRFPHYQVINTICDSTERRQADARRLAQTVDAVIVVGGRFSGNTKRLAEIVRSAGTPVYLIETEAELDMAALASAKSIGITAGASTPNWIIRGVCQRLETLSLKHQRPWRRLLHNIQYSFLLTNIYLSAGAGCLSYAAAKLLNYRISFAHLLIAMLYVQSMHMLNNLIGIKANYYNDPSRALFYKKHQVLLGLLAVISGGSGLITAFRLGQGPFWVLFVMSALGLLYNVKFLPGGPDVAKYRALKDIPGSKTVLISLAWGVVTVMFPYMDVFDGISPAAALIFFWSTALVFSRTAFFDILDMQGDRIVGKETLPMLFGERRAIYMIKLILAGSFFLLLISGIIQFISRAGFFLTLVPAYLFMLLTAYEKRRILPGTRLEFLVETNFLLAGILAFLGSMVIKP
ncbi:MAG: 4-hydroxy-3-methylbut-2-enyl diphosphate reductase [Desulfobacterales bacterium]|nr:4-hydroxy-3-methylbut-2-enyl diphosphate reductase [Desulfobacterales bacterium]